MADMCLLVLVAALQEAARKRGHRLVQLRTREEIECFFRINGAHPQKEKP